MQDGWITRKKVELHARWLNYKEEVEITNKRVELQERVWNYKQDGWIIRKGVELKSSRLSERILG